jgi:glutathione-independent formaldehyde dehydrogenase
MGSKRGIAYLVPGTLEVHRLGFPKRIEPGGRRSDHGMILRIAAINISGTDQEV